MLANTISIQHKKDTYTHPILYGEYVHETLYLLHPDKKIALNIPSQDIQKFTDTLFRNIQNKFSQSIPCFFIQSFETLAKSENFKLKKRKKLLPDAILFVPSQVNSQKIIDTDRFVTLTPDNTPIYFDYPKPDKTKFINQISHLQKKLTKGKNIINFSYTSHSKDNDQKIITNLPYPTNIKVKTPDFTLALHLQSFSKTSPNQDILFTENQPRNFQKGTLKFYQKDKSTDYSIDQSTNIIQTNITHNLSVKINDQTKPFTIFQKLSKAINQTNNA